MYEEVICDVSEEEYSIDFDRVKEKIEKRSGCGISNRIVIDHTPPYVS